MMKKVVIHTSPVDKETKYSLIAKLKNKKYVLTTLARGGGPGCPPPREFLSAPITFEVVEIFFGCVDLIEILGYPALLKYCANFQLLHYIGNPMFHFISI